MKKYKSIQEYIDNELCGDTREDMKEAILTVSLDLLGDCAHNFGGDSSKSEHAAIPLIFLNEILDQVD